MKNAIIGTSKIGEPPGSDCNSTTVTIAISAKILNKYGDKTQPCLTPLLTENQCDITSAILTFEYCLW